MYVSKLVKVRENAKNVKIISKMDSWFSYAKSNAVMIGHHIFVGCFAFSVITVSICCNFICKNDSSLHTPDKSIELLFYGIALCHTNNL